jgi:hypothetical protein
MGKIDRKILVQASLGMKVRTNLENKAKRVGSVTQVVEDQFSN